MSFEHTWRWFGPKDPISLKEIKQTGAVGIVTALHQVSAGEIWTTEDILERKYLIESEGLSWSVAESIPVHENIKKKKDNYKELIDNYRTSIINLGNCGITTVCYNFMPVLDWSRTDLNVVFNDGSITTKFDADVFGSFDLFILKREGAEKEYSPEQFSRSKQYYDNLDEEGKEKLIQTVLLGFPGSGEAYTLEGLKAAINGYKEIDDITLRNNLYSFIREIIPAAEKAGVFMGIHPDDPPFTLLGLPRIVSTKSDIQQILNAYDSVNNGVTFCTGSLGSGYKNNLVDMAETFAKRVNFVHLRNVKRNEAGDFIEDNHLDGDVDMYGVMRAILIEQKRRRNEGRKDYRMPMRPDHGHLMIPDQNREGIYPGYSLFGRMRGLAELRGLELGIERSL